MRTRARRCPQPEIRFTIDKIAKNVAEAIGPLLIGGFGPVMATAVKRAVASVHEVMPLGA